MTIPAPRLLVTQETPWDDLDQLYFSGYAMWTYLTVPFCLSWPEFEVAEIEPWQEENQTWRRLSVTFPAQIASHCTQQTFYFDGEGLLRRHDYEVEVAGNAPAAHYVSDYQQISGFRIPTRRRVFPRQRDNTPDRLGPDPGLCSLILPIPVGDRKSPAHRGLGWGRAARLVTSARHQVEDDVLGLDLIVSSNR